MKMLGPLLALLGALLVAGICTVIAIHIVVELWIEVQ